MYLNLVNEDGISIGFEFQENPLDITEQKEGSQNDI